VLKFTPELDTCVKRKMTRMTPSSSKMVEAVSQPLAFRDALAAPCTSPAAHALLTFEP
jgi:hypothetical protein